MPETYSDFARQPSKPHQCMHYSEEDGTQCRCTAMHNEYMCYHHRSDDIPTVIQNEPFFIERLSNRDAIQDAISALAARLACNRMDFKRAALLIQTLQIASSNLSAKERLAATHATVPVPISNPQPAESSAPPAPDPFDTVRCCIHSVDDMLQTKAFDPDAEQDQAEQNEAERAKQDQGEPDPAQAAHALEVRQSDPPASTTDNLLPLPLLPATLPSLAIVFTQPAAGEQFPVDSSSDRFAQIP